ncbi:DUF1295 domain-containing protein [Patescibacteria group bacterium]
MNPYLFALLVSLGINTLFFIFAYAFKTDKFTDFTYGMTFILLTIYFLISTGTYHSFQNLLSLMVIVWGVRLIAYLLIRILKIKKDKRFDQMRENALSFYKFWFFQGVAVWAIMLPTIYVLLEKKDIGIVPWMVVGMLIWALGLIIETVSDWQKFVFKNNKKNKGLWIDSGLWKYSRHPNYFGEILLWWGLFAYASPLLSGLGWFTIVGPMFITFILMFVSGIPLLEKKYDERHKSNKKYQEYKKSTSLLVIFPKKKI